MMCVVNEDECCMLINIDPWGYCLLLVTNSNKYSRVLSERSFLSLQKRKASVPRHHGSVTL